MGAAGVPPASRPAAMPAARPRPAPAVVAGLLLTLAGLAGCTGTRTYEIPLMPAPEYLDDADFNPFTGSTVLPADGRPDLLYATLRLPAAPDSGDRYYGDQRAQLVRLGASHVEAAGKGSWEQFRDITLLREKGGKFTLTVGDVTEFGALDRTRLAVDADPVARAADAEATRRFAAGINAQLARRQLQDVFVYVHGYRVNFENPLLVAAELWHFMGYEGVFVPFAWPSRTGRLAYFGDTESSRYSARGFRDFLRFLAEETNARRIHVIGYSAGTRMVLAAMHQLALQEAGAGRGPPRERLRLGNVVLVGSDVDAGIVSNYLQDGMLQVAERFTFYESPADKALGLSRRVLGQQRAGQLLELGLTDQARGFLLALDNLAIIDVGSAPFFDSGNGHSYFKDSPRVSSDLLATLGYGLGPGERGLVRAPGAIAWQFPPDYIDRLRGAIARRHGEAGATGAAPPSAAAAGGDQAATAVSGRAR
jgi:esterase/lipase superfamily enzyme